MRYTKSIWENGEGGWGYNILDFEAVCIHQEFHPSAEGNTNMTEQEANDFADAILLAWQSSEVTN